LHLTGEMRAVQDARDANPHSASRQSAHPDLPDMLAVYDRHASEIYAEDLAYYESAMLSRQQRGPVAPRNP
jgi:hypothetical protein